MGPMRKESATFPSHVVLISRGTTPPVHAVFILSARSFTVGQLQGSGEPLGQPFLDQNLLRFLHGRRRIMINRKLLLSLAGAAAAACMIYGTAQAAPASGPSLDALKTLGSDQSTVEKARCWRRCWRSRWGYRCRRVCRGRRW